MTTEEVSDTDPMTSEAAFNLDLDWTFDKG